ncbi:hypothetical protein L0128_11245 [candidate division KSB1 bacterium]|nr:hypothetical protein [candidate division KSB1 bacterium]
MTIREAIIDVIQKMPEPYLGELYEMIQNFEAARKKRTSPPGLMAKLRAIQISAARDFSQTADLVGRNTYREPRIKM